MTDDLEERLHTAVRAQARTEPPALAAAAAAAGLLDVAYVIEDSPLGPLLLAATDVGLVRLAYLDDATDPDDAADPGDATDPGDAEAAVLAVLAARVSPRVLRAPTRLEQPRRQLDDWFAGRRRDFALPLDRRLMSPFARRILAATSEIPFGATASYGAVAAAAGAPRGARAAGGALGANPLPIVIPCHRVLPSTGALGGYTGGPARKAALLAIESGEMPFGPS